jgi:hypothetical protein
MAARLATILLVELGEIDPSGDRNKRNAAVFWAKPSKIAGASLLAYHLRSMKPSILVDFG